MTIFDFTVEEINIIAIYRVETRAATLELIASAYPFMDEDILTIAKNAAGKLDALTEQEFSGLSFTLTDESDGDEDGESEGGGYDET